MAQFAHDYLVDTTYIYTFWPTYSPTHLQFTALFNGYKFELSDKPTYVELGCGQGFGTCVMAAANPDMRFIGVDFNAAHVQHARGLAAQAGLTNIEFVQSSFSDLLSTPTFFQLKADFVILHGVYTWVNDSNRNAIHAVIKAITRPGSLIYNSHNVLPGWGQYMPLQRLFSEHADRNPKDSSVQIVEAVQFAQQLSKVGFEFFHANPKAADNVRGLLGSSASYLAHEYLHKDMSYPYFADVARKFAKDNIEFVGNTRISNNKIKLDEIGEPHLKEALKDRIWFETLKDFKFNTQFRTDVYMREPIMLADNRRKDLLKKTRIASIWPAEELSFDFSGVDNQRISDVKIQNKIKVLFTNNVPTIEDLVNATKGTLDFEQTMDWLQTAIDRDMIRPARSVDADPAPSLRFNKLVVSENPYGERYTFIASPIFGSGLTCPHLLALSMKVFMENGAQDSAQMAASMEKDVRDSGQWVKGLNVHEGDHVRLNSEFAAFSYRFVHRILPNIQKMKCC
jgi:SAM-dependent methyltransferase